MENQPTASPAPPSDEPVWKQVGKAFPSETINVLNELGITPELATERDLKAAAGLVIAAHAGELAQVAGQQALQASGLVLDMRTVSPELSAGLAKAGLGHRELLEFAAGQYRNESPTVALKLLQRELSLANKHREEALRQIDEGLEPPVSFSIVRG